MVRAPRLTGKELVKSLQAYGFVVSRVRGSHHFMKHPDGRATVVPIHTNEIIGPGLLNKICRDSGMSPLDLL